MCGASALVASWNWATLAPLMWTLSPVAGAPFAAGQDTPVFADFKAKVAKLDTTALYTRVATKTISEVMSPLEHIALKLKEIRPPG